MTGSPAGSSANAYDLDGRTSIRSAVIRLPSTAGQRFTFRYVFAHDAKATSSDQLRAVVEAQDGTRTTVFTVAGKAADVDGVWRTASVLMDDWTSQSIRLRFEAVDGGSNNLVEVEVDDVRITRAP